MTAAITFTLPEELNATMPPERRGLRRDHVRMMVLDKTAGAVEHTQFHQLVNYLKKDDLIILNASRTVPAVLKGSWNNKEVEVRLARRISENTWEALVAGETPSVNEVITFTDVLTAAIIHTQTSQPLVTIQFNLCCSELYNQIYSIGQPVRYEYIDYPWDLDYYQTVFASVPGSVEMPSAGRAFSWELLFRLQKKGIKIAYIYLHTGLSYLLDDQWHLSPRENREEYHIPKAAADAIEEAKSTGGRIIAAGTTVVRTLETAAEKNGVIQAQSGWTNLYIHKDTKLRIADGLITGMHEPEASHLDLLSAFIHPSHLYRAYQDAIKQKYLWHEFGDMNLIL